MTDYDIGKRLQELCWRIDVKGTETSGYEAGVGSYTRYSAPWFVIDKANAEPEVNYPGELIGKFDEISDALKCRLTEIGRLYREEFGR